MAKRCYKHQCVWLINRAHKTIKQFTFYFENINTNILMLEKESDKHIKRIKIKKRKEKPDPLMVTFYNRAYRNISFMIARDIIKQLDYQVMLYFTTIYRQWRW